MQVSIPLRWAILVLLLAALFILNLALGSVDIPLAGILKILGGQEPEVQTWKEIVLDFRMPKAITCVLGGSALALGGLQMQTLFRNPLAGPDVLGLTAGASLAVSLVFMGNAAGTTVVPGQGAWTVAFAASLGCSLVFVVMILLSRRVTDNVSLLIVGLMIAAGTSSIVSVLQYLSRAEEMQIFLFWTFGSLGGLNWEEIRVLAFILTAGTIIAMLNTKSLNAWLLGDLYAQSMGINSRQARFYFILSASLLTGGVTAFCGPIAFVGLAVPHLVKLVIQTHDHKTLIPAVLIGGGILLLICDTLAHLPGSSYVLPINAITALVGAPVVIWVILRNKIVRN